jgi:hypothetical protein
MRRIGIFLLSVVTAGSMAACSSPSSAPHSASSSPIAELPSGAHIGSTPGIGAPPVSLKPSGHFRNVANNGDVQACSLVTGRQVNAIMSMTLPAPVTVSIGTFSECSTAQRLPASSHATPVRVAWAVPPKAGSAALYKQHTISLPGAVSVSGLGTKAICGRTVGAQSAQLYVLAGAQLVEVFADSCAHAEALAKIVVQRL